MQRRPQTLPSKMVRMFWLAGFLPLILSACLTTKGTKGTPSLRSLTPTEVEQLETLHQPERRAPRLRPEQPDSLPELVAEAQITFQLGDYDRTIFTCSKILHEDPQRHDIRYKLGVALMLTGRLEEARGELAQVLAAAPEHLEAHEALGIIHLHENRLADAQQEFRTVLSQNPERFQARVLLGEVHLRGGNFSQALQEFKAAAVQAPRSARILGNIGWAHYKLKHYEEAQRYLQQARNLQPQHPQLNHRLGMVLASQKNYPEALEAFRRSGDEAQALNNIGVYYYLDGRYEEAARCFQQALELRPVYYEEAKINLEKALARLQGEPVSRLETTPPPAAGSRRELPSLARNPEDD